LSIFIIAKDLDNNIKALSTHSLEEISNEVGDLLECAMNRSIEGRVTNFNNIELNWASETRFNYIWLLECFEKICCEYKERTGDDLSIADRIFEFDYGIIDIPAGERKPFPSLKR